LFGKTMTADKKEQRDGTQHRIFKVPQKDIDEVNGHGDDIVAHELHMEQDLIDGDIIKFPLCHDKERHAEAKEPVTEQRGYKTERKEKGFHSSAMHCQ
ncbi:MAG: hypothetical protein J6P53_06870, partial [Mailhella sp.]|nr:hypothetical protein [Mailhella sp.]